MWVMPSTRDRLHHMTRSQPMSPPTLSPPTLSPPILSPPTLSPPTMSPPTMSPPTSSDGTVAVAANFINKSAVQAFPFAPNAILLAQLLAMFATTQALRSLGCLSFPAFSTARYWQLLPLSLAYAAHASLVLRSLLYLNVAMYNTLKRLTPVMVLLFKACHEWKAPGAQEVACVCLIVSGCVVAGAGDLSYNASGYATALLCAALQAVYILLAEAKDHSHHPAAAKPNGSLERQPFLIMPSSGGVPIPAPSLKTAAAMDMTADWALGAGPAVAHVDGFASPQPHLSSSSGLEEPVLAPAHPAPSPLSSSGEVLYYTSLSAMPFLLLAVALTNEAAAAARMIPAMELGWSRCVPWAVAVCWCETALAGTLVWCTQCNNGLTTAIVGVLKGIVAVVLGFFFMAGAAQVTPMNVVGVAMVLAGGTWYATMQCSRKPRVAK